MSYGIGGIVAQVEVAGKRRWLTIRIAFGVGAG